MSEIKLSINKEKVHFFIKTYNLNTTEREYVYDMQVNILKYINMGDLQPAFVFSTNPLIIASYTDEFDDVILLKYPQEFVYEYKLKENDKLITSNVYWKINKTPYKDINLGILGSTTYKDVYPFVLKFLVNEEDEIKEYCTQFSDYIWEYLKNKTYGRVVLSQTEPRDGMFYYFRGDKR